jgi:hypothetical protein
MVFSLVDGAFEEGDLPAPEGLGGVAGHPFAGQAYVAELLSVLGGSRSAHLSPLRTI